MTKDPVKVALAAPRAENLAHREELTEAFTRVLERGSYVMGDEVEAFEHEWAAFCRAKFCVAVSSGTDAIYVALRAMELVFEGQRSPFPRMFSVYAPAFTFIGSVEPVVRARKPLYLVDVQEKTGLASISDLADAARGREEQSVLLPVHMYGYPTPWADRQYPVLEDSAQGHGLPLMGLIACHSFYPTKNLGGLGMGGAVVTNDEHLAKRMRSLRNHGEEGARFRHAYLCGNYRLDEVQAALLRVKLKYLGETNKARSHVAALYRKAWTDVGLNEVFPLQPHAAGHTYHIMALRAPSGELRGRLGRKLAGAGIETAVRYPIPIHLQPSLQVSAPPKSYPNAERWAATVLTLPMHPYVTGRDVEYIAASVRDFALKEKLI